MAPGMNSPRITAAARALCRKAAIEIDVDESEWWARFSDLFIDDAKAAIKAADAEAKATPAELSRDKEQIEKLLKANEILEQTNQIYRKKYGVLGQHEAT